MNERRLIGSTVRIAAASIAMGAAAFAVDSWMSTLIPQSALMWQILRLGATIAVSLVVLAAAAWILQIEEFNDSVQMVLRQLRRRST